MLCRPMQDATAFFCHVSQVAFNWDVVPRGNALRGAVTWWREQAGTGNGAMVMISLILAESALETVPSGLHSHPAVASHADRTGRHPMHMLLDNSWHYAAMKDLANADKRGRPDLVHIAIVTATSAPIYRKDRNLEIYVHTVDDHTIHFGPAATPAVRIPKSYHRFAGLMEKLYREDVLSSSSNGGDDDSAQDVLLRLRRGQTFADLLKEKKFSRVVGLSSKGVVSDLHDPYGSIAHSLPDNAAVVIGGFQKGHFSDRVMEHLDCLYSVGPEPLEAHVVIARLLYECEKKPFM